MSDFQITNSYYKKKHNTVWKKFNKQNQVYLFCWYSTTKSSQVNFYLNSHRIVILIQISALKYNIERLGRERKCQPHFLHLNQEPNQPKVTITTPKYKNLFGQTSKIVGCYTWAFTVSAIVSVHQRKHKKATK